ncbi:MAG: hypothetical protein KGN36_12000 [Acidobacteriota bacterium]|nr:hypothetical protein [Acidobacteriota bacterium]
MNRIVLSAGALPLLALAAAAQDAARIAEQKKMLDESVVRMKMIGSVKEPVVKNLPYSAEEVTEVNQTLSDGTRIHRETKVSVYRDNEGRTRREGPENITISDPVSGATYMVNPKTNAVRRLQMSNTFIYRKTGANEAGSVANFSLRTSGDGQTNIEVNGQALNPKAVAELIARAKADGSAEAKGGQVIAPSVGPGGGMVVVPDMAATPAGKTESESLGKKNFDGVIATGTRRVETIETGAIGNDRPIQVVNESWYSDELGATVYTRRSDPRSGEQIFRMTNIQRGDPPAALFQPPAESQVNEKKM